MGNNDEYVNSRVKRLTKEEIDEITKKKEEVIKNNSQIRAQISVLEKQLQELPHVKGAQFMHPQEIRGCGLKAVVNIGSDTSGEEVYFCYYCNHDFQLDPNDYRYSGIRPSL